MTIKPNDVIDLPEPGRDGPLSVEGALAGRRSVREFEAGALTLAEVSQLLWAAQGVTEPTGLRTAPSAGALYPLEVYLLAGDVAGLEAGVYKYDPARHALRLTAPRDIRREVADAALEQHWMAEGAAILVITADYGRTEVKYGGRAERYVDMEVGFAAENVCLQAVGLGLGTTVVGAFHDEAVKRLVGMAAQEDPLCCLPVGRPAA
jgi:SagB-type dehydrogenase family enzyme